MNSQEKVLNLLLKQPNQIISGQRMARELAISRNSIWKAINELNGLGYRIETHQSKGYQLKGLRKSIDPRQIRFALQAPYQDIFIHYENQVGSTNDLAREYSIYHPRKIAVFLADQQTNGRGRYGRDFYSHLKGGLYISVILPVQNLSIEEMGLFTLAGAVSMSKALERNQGIKINIKWINDLFMKASKIGGILCEANASLENSEIEEVIIGTGVNLWGHLPDHLSSFAGTVFGEDSPEHFNINQLISNYLNELLILYHQDFQGDLLTEYRQRLIGIDHEITYTIRGQERSGTIRGINELGHLLVDTKGRLEELMASEIHFKSDHFKEQIYEGS